MDQKAPTGWKLRCSQPSSPGIGCRGKLIDCLFLTFIVPEKACQIQRGDLVLSITRHENER